MSKTPAISWCRGRDSNPHVPFETQDFKTYFRFSPSHRFHSIAQSSRGLRASFSFCQTRPFQPIPRCSVSRVSASFSSRMDGPQLVNPGPHFYRGGDVVGPSEAERSFKSRTGVLIEDLLPKPVRVVRITRPLRPTPGKEMKVKPRGERSQELGRDALRIREYFAGLLLQRAHDGLTV